MQLGKQLFQENGEWIIEFRDSQMKVARKRGLRNVFRLSFPNDLTSLLEEYLEVWRPILNQDDLPNVFVTTRGGPWSPYALNKQIKRTIYAYTGKATNIHLFRDIWATEFILGTQDFTTAAEMLNDDIQTVLMPVGQPTNFFLQHCRLCGKRKHTYIGIRLHGGINHGVVKTTLHNLISLCSPAVSQLPFKQGVEGSNPSRLTSRNCTEEYRKLLSCGRSFLFGDNLQNPCHRATCDESGLLLLPHRSRA